MVSSVMQRRNNTYTIQGYKFTRKPTTQYNIETYQNFFSDMQENLNKVLERVTEIEKEYEENVDSMPDDIREEYESLLQEPIPTPIDIAVDKLRLLTDGPHDKIDPTQLDLWDVKIIEQDFFEPLSLN